MQSKRERSAGAGVLLCAVLVQTSVSVKNSNYEKIKKVKMLVSKEFDRSFCICRYLSVLVDSGGFRSLQ